MSTEKLEDIYSENDFPMEIDVPFHCDDGVQDLATLKYLAWSI